MTSSKMASIFMGKNAPCYTDFFNTASGVVVRTCRMLSYSNSLDSKLGLTISSIMVPYLERLDANKC